MIRNDIIIFKPYLLVYTQLVPNAVSTPISGGQGLHTYMHTYIHTYIRIDRVVVPTHLLDVSLRHNLCSYITHTTPKDCRQSPSRPQATTSINLPCRACTIPGNDRPLRYDVYRRTLVISIRNMSWIFNARHAHRVVIATTYIM